MLGRPGLEDVTSQKFALLAFFGRLHYYPICPAFNMFVVLLSSAKLCAYRQSLVLWTTILRKLVQTRASEREKRSNSRRAALPDQDQSVRREAVKAGTHSKTNAHRSPFVCHDSFRAVLAFRCQIMLFFPAGRVQCIAAQFYASSMMAK